MSGPILVTGPDRSGTSLLYALPGTHPNISMVRRSNMFRWFHRRYGDLADPENFERCLQPILHYGRLAPLQPDEERIRKEFREGEPTYGRLFEFFHRDRAERLGDLPSGPERTRPKPADLPCLVENLARMWAWMASDSERPGKGHGVPPSRRDPEKVT